MDDSEDDGTLWHYHPVEPKRANPVARFCCGLVAWGLLCVFAAGVSGLCVRLFNLAAWD